MNWRIGSAAGDSPSSGTHRKFSGGQAFWLGMVLRLKATGIKTPLVAKIDEQALLEVSTDGESLIVIPARAKRRRKKFEYALQSTNDCYVKALMRLAE